MIWTNRHNIPEPLAVAIKKAMGDYSKGDSDWSITQLLKPARQTALEDKHKDEIQTDVSEYIWILLGIGFHRVLDDADQINTTEGRLFMEMSGKRISGQMDCSSDLLIRDYKVTTAWKFISDKIPDEWAQQLNGYAELKRANGLPEPHALEITAILRDWSKMEATRDPSYPQLQVQTVQIPLWSQEETRQFFIERIFRHESAKKELPECTPKERWAKPDLWAVKKTLNSPRAVSGGIYDEEPSATAHAESIGGIVEFRCGQAIRCEQYCSVRDFCQQYQQSIKKG